MTPRSCIYCGDACERTIPLEWAVSETGNANVERVRLNLCERCSQSWTAFASDFCPEVTPEKRAG
jgi:hypothetical protein